MNSGMTPPQPAVLILKVNQRALQTRLDSPTAPARIDVGQTLRVSVGGSSPSYFPRGFFPGWLSSVNSPLVLGTT